MRSVGFTCGAFDITHAGHYLMFRQCKENCDYLVVGLQSDPTLDRPEKNKPVQSIEERMIQLESCKYVDKVIVYHTERDLVELLKEVKPHIRFIGTDWRGKRFTGDHLDIPIFWNNREHGYSSTFLRQRILGDSL